jgi:CheY-like chemotaxis protein
VAKTGEMGIHACQTPGSRRPDCVIVDIHVPDMNGLDVLKRLKNDAGEVQYPVVFFIDSGRSTRRRRRFGPAPTTISPSRG